MRLTYKIARNIDEVVELSKIALKNRLCVSGWMLQGRLYDMVNFPEKGAVTAIVIGYHEGVPVGVAALCWGRTVNVFVRAAMRKQGIGTKLLKRLKMPDNPNFLSGIEGSHIFYRKAMKEVRKG